MGRHLVESPTTPSSLHLVHLTILGSLILNFWLNTSNSAILSGKWLFYIFSGDKTYLLVPSHIFINKTVSLKIHFDENKYFTWKKKKKFFWKKKKKKKKKK